MFEKPNLRQKKEEVVANEAQLNQTTAENNGSQEDINDGMMEKIRKKTLALTFATGLLSALPNTVMAGQSEQEAISTLNQLDTCTEVVSDTAFQGLRNFLEKRLDAIKEAVEKKQNLNEQLDNDNDLLYAEYSEKMGEIFDMTDTADAERGYKIVKLLSFVRECERMEDTISFIEKKSALDAEINNTEPDMEEIDAIRTIVQNNKNKAEELISDYSDTNEEIRKIRDMVYDSHQ